MEKAISFDTAIGTSNIGDIVILESLETQLEPLLRQCFVVRYATHLKNFNFLTYLRLRAKRRYADACDYKFIMGTNLLSYDIFNTRRQWQIGLLTWPLYKNVVVAGVGTTQGKRRLTAYSKFIYKKILSKKYIHSVRDEESRELLESIGIKAINTGCPTLWKLTPEFCRQIPTGKAGACAFSLSGFKDQLDLEKDGKMLAILKQNYEKLYFWCQTTEDEKYLDTFPETADITRIYNLDVFGQLLDKGNIDYVGTRLHGGIFALQHKVRSIIISIDHRARGFRETNHIVTLERDEIEKLDDMINSEFRTEIVLKQENIDKWKSQFLSRGE